MWVSHPLQVSQLSQLSLSSFRVDKMSSKLESDVCCRLQVALSGESYEGKTQAWQKAMANYCWVYGVIHFTSPAG